MVQREYTKVYIAHRTLFILTALISCYSRGGGMIFPSVADIVVATEDATFGFPEIWRGVLPGVVSVHARRRLTDKQCKALHANS